MVHPFHLHRDHHIERCHQTQAVSRSYNVQLNDNTAEGDRHNNYYTVEYKGHFKYRAPLYTDAPTYTLEIHFLPLKVDNNLSVQKV